MSIFNLDPGQKLSEREVRDLFGGNAFGTIRIAEDFRLVTLIVDFANTAFFDHWNGNSLYFEFRPFNPYSSFNEARSIEDLSSAGYAFVLLEKYGKDNYYFRGELKYQQSVLLRKLGYLEEPVSFYLFQSIRHNLTEASNWQPISRLHIEITSDESAWGSYVNAMSRELFSLNSSGENFAYAEYSIWRSYASNVLNEFSEAFESRTASFAISEYDLERGSIKGALTLCAAVASITGGSIGAVANYPKAKENLPIIISDASKALDYAKSRLEAKYPGLLVTFPDRKQKDFWGDRFYAAFAPHYSRRKNKESPDGEILESSD